MRVDKWRREIAAARSFQLEGERVSGCVSAYRQEGYRPESDYDNRLGHDFSDGVACRTCGAPKAIPPPPQPWYRFITELLFWLAVFLVVSAVGGLLMLLLGLGMERLGWL